jgi:ABC-type transport system substrate-binding protein
VWHENPPSSNACMGRHASMVSRYLGAGERQGPAHRHDGLGYPLYRRSTHSGEEAFRFIGYQLYDALINWDLCQGDRLPDLIPGLAERGEVSKEDHTRWIFYLRWGVKFHDRIPFNANAILWNMDRIRNKDAPQFDPNKPPTSTLISPSSRAGVSSMTIRSSSPPSGPPASFLTK